MLPSYLAEEAIHHEFEKGVFFRGIAAGATTYSVAGGIVQITPIRDFRYEVHVANPFLETATLNQRLGATDLPIERTSEKPRDNRVRETGLGGLEEQSQQFTAPSCQVL